MSMLQVKALTLGNLIAAFGIPWGLNIFSVKTRVSTKVSYLRRIIIRRESILAVILTALMSKGMKCKS